MPREQVLKTFDNGVDYIDYEIREDGSHNQYYYAPLTNATGTLIGYVLIASDDVNNLPTELE